MDIDTSSILIFSVEGPSYELEYSGHEYNVTIAAGIATWVNMADVCAGLGMKMVSFETNEEYEAVRDYILTCMYMYLILCE